MRAGWLAVSLLCATLSPTVRAFEVEMAPVALNDTFSIPSWTTVTFLEPFDVRPIVFVLPTNQGGDPSTIRVRNVTTTGFEVLQVEPSGNDGPHVAMTTAYLAIEPGNHVLPNGTRIVALEHTTATFANRFLGVSWDVVPFPAAFPATPAVVAQIQTAASESQSPPSTPSAPFMDVSLQNLGPASVQITLERAESVAGTVVPERIGIVAIEDATNTSFIDGFGTAVQLQSIATPDNIQGWSNGCYTNAYPVPFAAIPLAVASVNSRDGNNGGWIRRCSESSSTLGLTVDEDTDNDSERNHTTESAGVIAASTAFHANFDVDLAIAKTVTTTWDPVNGGSGPYSIPDATVEYTIAVENRGSLSPDTNSLTVTDDVPPDLSLCVTASCLAGAPIVLDVSNSPVPPGIALGSIEYSDDNGVSFGYAPNPDTAGYDPNINAIRVTMNGAFGSISTSGPPSFELILGAKIQ
ncbi:MAG: hypothetical protein QNI98_06440 [Woeseiaceae bacterium]|nr:hypothetical protein [Woeseiaceae bacterium]